MLQSRQGSRWRKPVLTIVFVLMAVAVVYAIAINVLLRNGQLARWLNRATDDVHIEIDSGWSPWPGRVHAREIRFRFEDRNVQFLAVVQNAVVDISLLELPRHRVHLRRVRGDGTRYLFRHKVERAAGLERRLARYPSIPGFSDPPLITEPRTPPLSDEEYNLWTVQLSDVDVQVSELWFQEYRFRGKGRARGGFRLQPERDALTERCLLDLIGNISSGPDTVLRGLVGTLEVMLDRHDPRRVAGEQIFGKISVRADLRGDVPNLKISELYTKPGELRIERGAGELTLEADYQHGAWTKGSHARYETRGLTLRRGPLSVTAGGALEATIVEGNHNSRVKLEFASPRAQLRHRRVPEGFEQPFARAVRISARSTADLTRRQTWTSLSIDLQAVLPDARWLDQALDSKNDLFSGGRAEAHLSADWRVREPASAELQLALHDVALVADKKPIELSGELEAQASYDPKSERGQFRALSLSLAQLRVSESDLPEGVQIRGDQAVWQGLPPRRSEARLEVTSADVAPLLPLAVSSSILRGFVKLFVHLGDTRAVFQVDQTPAAWELRLTEARSGNVTAVGELRKDRDAPHVCSRWYVRAGSTSAGLLIGGGKTAVKPLVSPSWWRERPVGLRCASAG